MAGSATEPLWQSCANWLCALEILPSNHRCRWPDATMKDLAYALRDGVLLCGVASRLDPASIDQKNVNQRPQMAQFLCLKNIKIFLGACKEAFNLKETDLFQPSMLYDYTDFARVLQTLSKLSHCEVARKKDVEGFPPRFQRGGSFNASSVARPSTRHAQHEEEIYRY